MSSQISFVALPPIDDTLLCQLPNGTCLRWCGPNKRTPFTEFRNEKDDNSLQHYIDSANSKLRRASSEDERKERKRNFPKVHLLPITSNQKVITADFDNLPIGYTSFDTLYKNLCIRYPNAVVARTVSCKVKMFFVINYYYRTHALSSPKVTCDKALKFLDNFLNDATLFAAIDRNYSAFLITFLSDDIREKLKLLRQLTPIDYPEDNLVPVSKAELPDKKTKHKFRFYDGNLDEPLVTIINKWRSPKRAHVEKLFRYLIACPRLATTNGYDLATTIVKKITKQSIKTAANWLRQLETNYCLLACIDGTTIPGRKARTFIAKNALLEAIKKYNPEAMNIVQLPTTFENGDWYSGGMATILYIVGKSKHKSDIEIRAEVTNWINSLDGVNAKPDRKQKLESLAQTAIKNPNYLPKWRKEKK